MPDFPCRLARLEEKVHHMSELEAKVDQILENQTKQRGFVAGVTFTVGALASILTMAFDKGWFK